MRALWLVAVLAAAALPGAAAADLYADWIFDVEKAEKSQDLAALASQAQKQPGFARIWFYGQVFDLVNDAVPVATRTALRPGLTAVAEALAAASPPDNLPLMYLDRVDSGVLAAQAQVARKLQEDAIGAVGAGTPVGAALAAVERPELAQWAYHTLFDRAYRARKRLGGAREEASLLTVARRMAEGYALALDALAPMQTLLAWHGPAGLPQERLVLEAEIDRALLALLNDQPAEARKTLEAAVNLSRSTQGNSLMTALVLNGVALAAGRAGDRAQEAAIRLQVLQAVRPLAKPPLTALAAANLLRSYLAAGDLPSALPYAKELRELGAPATEVAAHLWTLEAAQAALAAGAGPASQAGDFARAEGYLDEAVLLAATLATQDAVARQVPAAAVTETLQQRQIRLAGLQTEQGRLAHRRAQFNVAEFAYSSAANTWQDALSRPDRVAALALDRAVNTLEAGLEDQALDLADAALAGAGGEDRALVQARAHGVKARVRLRQGGYAPAFAHVNRALELLRDAGLADAQVALRAELHLTAGAALHAVGYAGEARERLAFATRLAPGRLRYVRPLALAALDAGDADAALAAFEGALSGPEGRAARIDRGCVLTLAGRHAEAVPLLEDAKGLMLPHLRDVHHTGLACLAHALLAQGDAAGADRVLAPVRILAAHPQTPAGIAWRLLALDGRIARARGDALTAGRRWQQAAQRFAEIAAERPARGLTLDLRWLAAPARPDQLLTEGPATLAAAAAKAPAKERDGLHRAAVALLLYGQALAAGPRGGALDEGAARPAEAERGFRAALARAADARRLLRDPLQGGNDRARLLQIEQERVASVALGRKELDAQAPAWIDYTAPAWPLERVDPAADEARLYFHVTEGATHLWTLVPGQPVRYDRLPGAAELEKLIAPALAALSAPPAPWPAQDPTARRAPKPKDPNGAAWAALQAPVPKLLPFLGDKTLAAALTGKALRIFPDGPLLGLPFAALVLGPPPQPGAPPRFLGAQHPIRVSLSLQRPPPAATATRILAAVGPLGPGDGCPAAAEGQDLCGGADQAAELAEVEAAFAVAPERFSKLGGDAVSVAGINQLLRDAAAIWWLAPVDLSAGALLASPQGGAPYPRLAGEALGLGLPGATRAMAFTRPSAQADAAALRRLAAALRARGVAQILLSVGRVPDDAERAGALAARLAGGEALSAALSTLTASRAEANVDPMAGGPADHHPQRWARWLLID